MQSSYSVKGFRECNFYYLDWHAPDNYFKGIVIYFRGRLRSIRSNEEWEYWKIFPNIRQCFRLSDSLRQAKIQMQLRKLIKR